MTSPGIDYEASRVILLGTSVYDNSSLGDVPAVKHSMRGMYAMLTSPRHGGWPEDRVEFWLDRGNARAVAKDLRELAKATAGVFIFYFVGHGTLIEGDQLCLMLTDTEDDDPDLTGLELLQVSRALGHSSAQTNMVILDCCYANRAIGYMAGAGAPTVESTPGTYTLTATNRLQQLAKWSGQDDQTPTAFTGELLTLIRAGKNDGPEWLSLNDFYPSLRKRLIDLDLPRPSNDASDMAVRQPFTLNAAHPSPDGADIVPPPFFAPTVPGSRGTSGPPRALAARMLLPFSAASAAFRRLGLRYSRLAARTRRTALAVAAAVSLAAAAFAGYALNPGTPITSPSAVPAGLHLSQVYGMDLGPGSSYGFAPNIHADQAFRSTQPYIDAVGVVVGLNAAIQRVATHTLEVQVLNSAGTVLGDGCATLVNNGNTTVTFPDISTKPNQVYRFRVWNRSGDDLGIYIDKAGSKSGNVGIATINGVEQEQQGIIAGFVEGRNLPTQGTQIHSPRCAG